MTWTRIEYGADVTSSALNNNFEALEDMIVDNATNITTLQSSIQSVNTNLNSEINDAKADIDDLVDVTNPTITVLSSSGTISLIDNSINTITPSESVTFVLPSITDNDKFHQILVQVNLTTVYSINVGTTHFFNNKSPDLSAIGVYNLVFEYDKANSIWVCGWMRKS